MHLPRATESLAALNVQLYGLALRRCYFGYGDAVTCFVMTFRWVVQTC